ASKRALLWIDGDPARVEQASKVFSNRMDMVARDTYPFMEKDYPTVRMWVSLLAGAHVADEVVYKYVKAVAENEDRVQKIGGSLKVFATQGMARDPSALPYHPGALRYYKEKGLVK
ncbi:MAG TPA: TAXI family TRAP transporter solute-binding subunit, partial [Burkholderiales bacterium]